MRLTTFAHAGNLAKGILMSVPTYDKFIEPILRYLAANPEGATARDAHEAAAQALNYLNHNGKS
jgi:restriction endonuclease Mrr